MNLRIGHGYDAHRLVENRKLILGGEEIPYEFGLLGHSDADVLTHAVMDAILGALALGDIGKMFPDNDPLYKDADSIRLLGKVRLMMEEMGWQLGNLDVTVIAQAPKLKPYLEQMRRNLAEACAATMGQISIKATTEEEMGFTGSGEGICAHAVCLLSAREKR
ncbi:MAG: 2-C-methyl-D-erythritol 2,4-cyclodiphosphate synthase [Anaerotruncus sp.]|jgi:2-C-methyl-D-erythritol 2,4-cyclodiphosphate synthase|nr:2-C-methyl-D-erythritol 2,4-cyclodiphosphate synthase [Anaerotruncus sp.]